MQRLLPVIGAAAGSGGGWLGAAAGAALGAGAKAAADKINQRIVTRVASGAMDSQEAARMIRRHLAENPDNSSALLRAYPEWAKLIGVRSEEHTSELRSLMRISYAVFCVKKKTTR